MTAAGWQATLVLRTSAGMGGLWQPEHFEHVTSLDAWEDEVSEDLGLSRHIEAGAFVPLNVGGDGVFQVVLQESGRTDRQARHTLVSSQPYLLISNGTLALGGLETVGSYIGGAHVVQFKPGRFVVRVHLIDWKAEPNSMDENGKPTADALPDFVVEINLESAPLPAYRRSVQTFERP